MRPLNEDLRVEKNLYVMLSVKVIENGVVWNEINVEYPQQSKDSYLELEKRITETLIGIGVDMQSARNAPQKITK